MNQFDFSQYIPYIFSIIGVILILYAILFNSKKSKLKETGIQVDGIVFKQTFDNNFNNSASSLKDKVVIRFVTKEMVWVTEKMDQDFQISYTNQYKDGETVKVFYDPENPKRFYVDSKQSELKGRLLISVIGLLFILCVLYKMFV